MGRPRKNPGTTYRGKRQIKAAEKELEKKRKLEEKSAEKNCGSRDCVLVQIMISVRFHRYEGNMEGSLGRRLAVVNRRLLKRLEQRLGRVQVMK